MNQYYFCSLCRVHRRIQKGFDVFEYYANNQWDFDNTNILYLRSIVNDLERKKYAIQDDSMLRKFFMLDAFVNFSFSFRRYKFASIL